MIFELELVNRVRALTIALLPGEVDPKVINEPTSKIITPHVTKAFIDAAGDFIEAVGFIKLERIFFRTNEVK
jgi:hypothetical protein